MGIKDFFLPTIAPVENTIDAAAYPAPNNGIINNWLYPVSTASRASAMAVPTIARGRNILCSLATLPLEQYLKTDGSHVEPNRVINQPDPRVAGSAIYSYVAEDLLFLGVSYGMIMSMYADGRIQEWTRISPDRVLPELNSLGTEIIGYSVDNKKVPPFGVGSLVVFNGLDEGFHSSIYLIIQRYNNLFIKQNPSLKGGVCYVYFSLVILGYNASSIPNFLAVS